MKRSTIFLCLPASFFVAVPLLVFGVAAFLPRNLSLGDFGSDVKLLQAFLNRDADTRVAQSGPGSPGQETLYFGPGTRRAVIAFQNKYKEEVLKPAGLAFGSGFFGPLTRQKLQEITVAKSAPSPSPRVNVSAPAAPSATSAGTPAAPASVAIPDELKAPLVPKPLPPQYAASANPNYIDIGYLLAAVKRVGRKQGYATAELETLNGEILAVAATTTNFKKRFIDEAFEKSVSVEETPSLFSRVVRRGLYAVLSVFRAKEAYAQSGLDFGGRLLFPFLCTCSGNWLMTLMPTAPTYVVLLTHYSGQQRFRNYNAPFTQMLLGKYTPGAGNCQFYVGISCVSIPSEGATTAFLGSS